ncbi:MAG: Hpt domain-containing protein [Fibrobacterota bacterium]
MLKSRRIPDIPLLLRNNFYRLYPFLSGMILFVSAGYNLISGASLYLPLLKLGAGTAVFIWFFRMPRPAEFQESIILLRETFLLTLTSLLILNLSSLVDGLSYYHYNLLSLLLGATYLRCHHQAPAVLPLAAFLFFSDSVSFSSSSEAVFSGSTYAIVGLIGYFFGDLVVQTFRNRREFTLNSLLESLEESLGQFYYLAEGTAPAVALFTGDGEPLYFNSAYRAYLHPEKADSAIYSSYRLTGDVNFSDVSFTSLFQEGRPRVIRSGYNRSAGASGGSYVHLTSVFSPVEIAGTGSCVLQVFSAHGLSRASALTTNAINQKYQKLLNNNFSQLWYLTDPDTLGFANLTFAEFHGITTRDVFNKPIRAIYEAGLCSEVVRENRTVFNERRQVIRQRHMTSAEGQTRVLRIIKTPKLDFSGGVECVMCEATDITEMYDEKLQLSALNSNLERERERADAMSRAKSSFVANMSHELRTPLNGVIGMAELLLDSSLSREQEEFSRIIYKSGKHLLSVINDVLDFSHIESGNIRIESAPTELSSIVADAVEVIMPRAEQKSVDIIVDDRECWGDVVRADGIKIKQILINLIGNAVKFTAQGAVLIRIQRSPGKDGFHGYTFSVQDTGIGISRKRQEELVDPFIQGDSSVTRRFGGIGLGLAISKKLVEYMGGALQCESTPGLGSDFSFTLHLSSVGYREMPEPLSRIQSVVYVDNQEWAISTAESFADSLGISFHAIRDRKALREELGEHIMSGRSAQVVIIKNRGSSDRECIPLVESLCREPLFAGVSVILLSDSSSHLHAYPRGVRRIRGPLSYAHFIEMVQYSRADSPSEERLLIVEDNSVNQKIMASLAESCACTAYDIAETAEKALEFLKQREYTVIITDWNLPGMNGDELIRTIRRGAAYDMNRSVRAVAVSARSKADVRRAARDAGFDEYIVKPVSQRDIMGIFDWLRKDGGDESRAGEPDTIDFNRYVLFNRAYITDKLMGDTDTLRRLLSEFVSVIPKKCNEARQRFQSGDYEGLREVVHSVHGAALNIGASRLGEVTREIEDAVGSPDTTRRLARLLDELIRVNDDLTGELTAVLNEIAAQGTEESKDDRGGASANDPASDTELEGAVLNVDDILDNLMDDYEILREILQEFEKSMPAIVRELEEAVRTEDFRKIDDSAHSIKGAARNIGAERLGNISYRLEMCGKKKNGDSLEKNLSLLHREFDTLIGEIRKIRE